MLEDIGAVFSPVERYNFEPYIATARAKLDEATWEAAWTEGRAMTPEQTVQYALEEVEEPTPPPTPVTSAPTYPAGLSARETEVLELVAKGLTNAKVAEKLFISPNTVNRHLNSIYGKLGVSSRAVATRFAVEHGLIVSDQS